MCRCQAQESARVRGVNLSKRQAGSPAPYQAFLLPLPLWLSLEGFSVLFSSSNSTTLLILFLFPSVFIATLAWPRLAAVPMEPCLCGLLHWLTARPGLESAFLPKLWEFMHHVCSGGVRYRGGSLPPLHRASSQHFLRHLSPLTRT